MKLVFGLLVLLASACQSGDYDAHTPDMTSNEVQLAGVNASGEHLASITPSAAAVASSRPTKREAGRQTVAPPLDESVATSLAERSRLVVAPLTALAISEPTACDFTSVASSYQDRSRCRAGSGYRVVGRAERLDPHVPYEIEDADAFGWGPRLLGRLAQPLTVADDVLLPTKGGTWARCADAGPTDPCGSNRWDLVTHGVSYQRWIDGRLVEQWRRDSSWIPPSLDALSQQWEPLHQAAIRGATVLIPESHGRVSVVDRATGQLISTVQSPDSSPTLLTAISSPIAVNPVDGIAWYTVMRISATNPYDVDNSWLVRVFPDGTSESRSINLLTQRDPLCVVTFAFNNYLNPPRPELTVKPWPPYVGAVGPTFPCRQVRPVVNAAPAFSLDGRKVYIVSRPYQNSDHVQVTAVDAGGLFRIWTESLRDFLSDGCGTLDRVGAIGSTDPTKCRYGSAPGIDKVTGLMPGGYGLDLSVASPVPTPDGGVMVGTYTPYDNERGHTFVLNPTGHKFSVNFGWNLSPNWRASRSIPSLPYEFNVVQPDSHYDNAPFRMLSWHGTYGFSHPTGWSLSAPGTQTCTRDGDVVDCQPAARLPGTGQNNLVCGQFSNWANSGNFCSTIAGGGNPFTFIPRIPLVVGTNGNVWTMGTDGFATLLEGTTGAVLERVFVDSSLVQSDSGMSVDSSGRVYVEYGGNVTVLAPSN